MGTPRPPSPDQDRALVEAVLAQRPGAFEALVRDYQRLCWSIINRMVRHPEDTRDLCQETFLRVHRHLHQYRGESPLRAWIGQVAYSVAVRHLNKKRVPLVEPGREEDAAARIEQVPDDFDMEAVHADAQLMALVREQIEMLPPLQRTLLTMYHYEELPIGEIAAICDLPEGTIKSHLFRSRARLRERLEARLEDTA